jgi:DNA-binding transcriptional LysR family regulator
MEFKQLEMFIAVAEERSVQRATERVFRSQPAVSMAIAKLEEEVGSPLFHRTRSERFRLTDVGEVLYDYAKRVIALRDEAALTVERIVHNRVTTAGTSTRTESGGSST